MFSLIFSVINCAFSRANDLLLLLQSNGVRAARCSETLH